jgi:hypothetical protein
MNLIMKSLLILSLLRYITPAVYKTCRHPMQCGIMMIIIFANPNYTLGRFLLVNLFIIGDVWGVFFKRRDR